MVIARTASPSDIFRLADISIQDPRWCTSVYPHINGRYWRKHCNGMTEDIGTCPWPKRSTLDSMCKASNFERARGSAESWSAPGIHWGSKDSLYSRILGSP